MEKITISDWKIIEEKGQPFILASRLSDLFISFLILSGIEFIILADIQRGGFSESIKTFLYISFGLNSIALFLVGVGFLPYVAGANPNSFFIYQGDLVCLDSFKKGWRKSLREFGEFRVQSASQHQLVIEVVEKDSEKIWGCLCIKELNPEKDAPLQLLIEAIESEPVLFTQLVWTNLECEGQRGLQDLLIHTVARVTL